jgi:Pyruvate/2-oxoacid:ferredoxin oxidoreductase delta subunit
MTIFKKKKEHREHAERGESGEYTEKSPTLQELRRAELQKCYPYCAECGESVQSDAAGVTVTEFCPDCGARLMQPKLCEFCGNVVWGKSEFCMGCGIRVIR